MKFDGLAKPKGYQALAAASSFRRLLHPHHAGAAQGRAGNRADGPRHHGAGGRAGGGAGCGVRPAGRQGQAQRRANQQAECHSHGQSSGYDDIRQGNAAGRGQVAAFAKARPIVAQTGQLP